MKAVIIGGGGHIGSYLVPKLVRSGCTVANVSRGQSKPYLADSAWNEVENIILDREKESEGAFERKIATLNADIVIDLINFSLESTRHIVEALKNTNLSHYLFCSTIWVHGPASVIPVTEDMPKYPIDDYGEKKSECDSFLLERHRLEGFPVTIVMPGHICGPGWNIINPVGNIDPLVFQKIGRGEEIALPNFGLETLNHVHADDVAQVFMNAILRRNQSLGENFHAVADGCLTLSGYAHAMYRWFGREPKIKFLSWDEWRAYTGDEALADMTYYHIARSGSYSIEKARRLIGYQPRYAPLEAIYQSVESMLKRKVIVL